MRFTKLSIEVFTDAVGKPYVVIEGWPDNEESGAAQAPGLSIKAWADEVTVADSRVTPPTPDPFPPSRHWKPGERFIVPGHAGSYPDRSKDRYGTVVGFRSVPYIHEHLVVRLDGEDADHESFNPDIMRHPREGEGS